MKVETALEIHLWYWSDKETKVYKVDVNSIDMIEFEKHRADRFRHEDVSAWIIDKPRFSWRGMMFDVSRHFFSKADVKVFIDDMARYKYNRFHWHLTDDQGWRIEIKALPRLTSVGAWRAERKGKWMKELRQVAILLFRGHCRTKKSEFIKHICCRGFFTG